jgi:hypothetical protein
MLEEILHLDEAGEALVTGSLQMFTWVKEARGLNSHYGVLHTYCLGDDNCGWRKELFHEDLGLLIPVQDDTTAPKMEIRLVIYEIVAADEFDCKYWDPGSPGSSKSIELTRFCADFHPANLLCLPIIWMMQQKCSVAYKFAWIMPWGAQVVSDFQLLMVQIGYLTEQVPNSAVKDGLLSFKSRIWVGANKTLHSTLISALHSSTTQILLYMIFPWRIGLVRSEGRSSVDASGDYILEWSGAYRVHGELAVHKGLTDNLAAMVVLLGLSGSSPTTSQDWFHKVLYVWIVEYFDSAKLEKS